MHILAYDFSTSFLNASQTTPEYFDDTYFRLSSALHKAIHTASISLDKSPLTEETFAQFSAYVEGISIADLEEEITNFRDGNTVRNRILRFIQQRTERNETFPLAGHIVRIGSSWDGTKVGASG